MALNQHDDLETNSKHINNILHNDLSFANFEKVIKTCPINTLLQKSPLITK
jgi:hypothetical protein